LDRRVTKRHDDEDDQFRRKVERAQQIIKNLVENDDPDAIEFVTDLFEHLPETDSIDQNSWNKRWIDTAQRCGVKFLTSLSARAIAELAEKLFSKIW